MLGALTCVGYMLVARVVEDLYPFSTFSMYARAQPGAGSRIVARDEHGRLREVTEVTDWACETAALDPYACEDAEVHGVGYVDRAAIDWVREHAGDHPDARPVDLVRRIWRFPAGWGPPITSECLISRCRAVIP